MNQELPSPPSIKLILTLALAGAFAGLLLVLVFQGTQPRIQAYKAEQLRLAVGEVLNGPTRYDTYYLLNRGLHKNLPEGTEAKGLDKVFLGFDAQGQPIGFAITAAKPGFQDVIRMLYGYSPDTKKMLGLKVLENKETPGLGDKILEPSFLEQFQGALTPLQKIKPGAGKGLAQEIDMITGATISSRTVIDAVNASLEYWEPFLLPVWAEVQP